MIPLFKSHFSIGKSILTFEVPDKDFDPEGSPSIIKIVKENHPRNVFLVEDSMTGFPEAFKAFEKINKKFTFGLRFNYGDEEGSSKIVAFAKNDEGINKLNALHSESFGNGYCTKSFMESWKDDSVALVIPFYDSFLFKNFLENGSVVFDLMDFDLTFFVEENELPFDNILRSKVESFAKDFKFDTELAKSIYYENREDAEALQTLKIITNRSFGKARSLSRPELNHFGSREFCWESYKEKTDE